MFTGANVHWGRSGAKAPPGALKRAIYLKNVPKDKGSISDKESISDKGSISDKESISYIISPKNRCQVSHDRVAGSHVSRATTGLRGAT